MLHKKNTQGYINLNKKVYLKFGQILPKALSAYQRSQTVIQIKDTKAKHDTVTKFKNMLLKNAKFFFKQKNDPHEKNLK